jgi:hypothetical protein
MATDAITILFTDGTTTAPYHYTTTKKWLLFHIHLRCFTRKDDLSGYIETRIDMEIGMPA